MNPVEVYDYETAGLDSFLSRSIDSIQQVNLDSGGPVSTQMRFDDASISGSIGDIFRLRNIVFNGRDGTVTLGSETDSASIVIDGPNRRIVLSDEESGRIVIGNFGT